MRLLAAVAGLVVGLATAPSAHAAGRDDTASLQARLDAGGTVSIPKLPGGRCYATRGLWVSRDDTTITSDGACIVALGYGEARFRNGNGKPAKAKAVFDLDHSRLVDPAPVRVAISGVHVVVPARRRMVGIAIYGHETMLDHVKVTGAPTADVVVGSGARGAGGPSERIAIRDSYLAGGTRDVLSVYGPVGFRLEGTTLAGARGTRRTQVAAGLHVRAADRGQPTLDVHVVGNTVVDNAGPGIFLELDPTNGAPVVASGIELSGNRVLRNARHAPAGRRGGIVLAGGQDDGKGSLVLQDNVVRGNRGPGVLRRDLRLAVTGAGNDLRGNSGGTVRGGVAAPQAGSSRSRVEPPPATGGVRDDTSWLQARLDAGGGTIFLPRLPDGACYATRGLWVSHDDTTVTSDGACIVSLGAGEVRLHSIDGDPIPATAVFFVNRSRPARPTPVRVTISNLRIVVPAGQGLYGLAVFGHEVTLSGLDVEGAPKDDVLIGGRANGNGYAADVAVLDSILTGATRNAISAFGVLGLRIERNTIRNVQDLGGGPEAGIDVEPDDRGQPTLDVRIAGNTIRDNAGPGILFELESNSGPGVLASGLEISGNSILWNGHGRRAPKRGGIVVTGGQDGAGGTLALKDNVIGDNGGFGVLALRLRLVVDASGNTFAGNADGAAQGLQLTGSA